MRKNYYAILGLLPGASEAEIRGAYRQLARRHHPDLHPDERDAEARLKELNEAYEVLGNAERRASYLAAHQAPPVRVRVRPSPRPAPRQPGWPYSSPVDLSGARPTSPSHVDLSRARPRPSPGPASREEPVDPWQRRRELEELELLWRWHRLLRALLDW
jgi:curved DNA-binding protein CbpA